MNAEIELSMRRSRKRCDAFLMLASLSEATPTALAKACGIDARRLGQIMHGDGEYYRIELALVTLGLAIEILTPNGRIYRITERGRKKARQIAARFVRKAVARRAVREHLGLDRRPDTEPAPPVAAPAAAWSVSWSVTCV